MNWLAGRAFDRRRRSLGTSQTARPVSLYIFLDFRFALTQTFHLQLEVFLFLEENLQIQRFLVTRLIINRDRIASRRAVAGARESLDLVAAFNYRNCGRKKSVCRE